MKSPYREAERYAWLPMLVMAMAGGCVLTILIALSLVEDRLVAQAGRNLQRTATEVAEKLDLVLYERYGDIQLLAETLAEMEEGPPKWTAHLDKVRNVYPLYTWIRVLDDKGRVVAATDHAMIGMDLGAKDWFKDIAGTPNSAMRDVRMNVLSDGKNAIQFSAPITIFGPTSSYGTVVSRVEFSELDSIVMRTLPDRGTITESEYKQVVDYHVLSRQGVVLYESGSQGSGFADLVAFGVESARRVVAGQSGFIEEVHARRAVPVVTGYARMPVRRGLEPLEWGVLVRRDRADVLAPIRSTLWTVANWSALFLTPILGLLMWTTNRVRNEWRNAESSRKASKEAQQFLQSSLDALTSKIAVLDERGTILSVNRAWTKMEDRHQLTDMRVGQNYLESCESLEGEGAEEAHRIANGLRAILRGDQHEWSTQCLSYMSGEPRWILARISTFELEGQRRVVVDHQDVTSSQLTLQALQESEATTHAIIRHALDAHILMDEEGVVVGWNPRAEEIFGWPLEEALGMALSTLIIPPAYREAHDRGLKKFLTTGAGPVLGKRIDIEGWHKEGRAFPVELTITPIKRPGGYLFSAFIRDTSERMLRQRRQAVQARIAALLLEAESLEAISHEVMATVCDTLGWRLAVLWQVNEDLQVLQCAAIGKDPKGPFEPFVEQTKTLTFVRGTGLPGRVWESGGVAWIEDVTRDSNFPRAPLAESAGLHGAFAFPIKTRGTVQAVIEFFADEIRPRDQALLELIEGLALQLSHFLEQKMAERSLRRSEARFSGILQLSHDAIVSVDDAQRIILFNQGAEQIFGYAATDVLGRPLDVLLPSRFGMSHRRLVTEFGASPHIAQGMMGRNEIVGLRKSGEEFPAEASIAKVTVEGATTYTAILRDISVRKKQEQDLHQAKESAEEAVSEKTALLGAVEAFFIRLTDRGKVSEWTPQAEHQLGVSRTDAIGQLFQDLPINWDWEAIQRAVDQATKTVSTIQLEKVRVIVGENRQHFLKLTVSPLCRESGVEVVLFGDDITDYLLLEQDLVQAQKLESIGQLAAGIAHEINTPTQFVGDNIRFLSDSFTGLLGVLARHQKLVTSAKSGACAPDLIEACEAETRRADLEYLTEEIPKALAQSTEGVERIAKIVRAMKDFAHPGSDEKTRVDLNKAIMSTVTVASNEWKYVAEMKTDLAPTLPLVPCLLGQFNQVVLNMIVNACHAIADAVKGTGRKGTITITTRSVEQYAEIRIADSGTGIPENIRHKIFDPFFTTKEVGKGTGQGLAIARSVIIDKHQGSVTVETEVGKGTTFVIRLPLDVSLAQHATAA